MSAKRLFAVVVSLVFVAAACGSNSTSGNTPNSTQNAREVPAQFRIEKVAEIETPTAAAVRPGDDANVMYIASQDGRMFRVNTQTKSSEVVASFANKTEAKGERGLLGIAFSNNGNELYAYYTNLEGDSRVVAVPWVNGAANVNDERVLLAVDQPYANHNGGQLWVDRDDNLLIALGDGGSGGDPQGYGQNKQSLLGKILRIRPNSAGSAQPYAIPANNPFANGVDGAPEVLTWGLRNPWRFSIDDQTNDFWIADVGQDSMEEINRISYDQPSVNLGWAVKEGTSDYKGTTTETLVDPVFEWKNVGGSSAIGGYVVRDSSVAQLNGKYVFADFAKPQIYLYDLKTSTVEVVKANLPRIVGFGVDANGELLVLTYNEGIYKIIS